MTRNPIRQTGMCAECEHADWAREKCTHPDLAGYPCPTRKDAMTQHDFDFAAPAGTATRRTGPDTSELAEARNARSAARRKTAADVLDALGHAPPTGYTDAEIAAMLNVTRAEASSPRYHAMRRGLVEVVETRMCRIALTPAKAWTLTADPPGDDGSGGR